MEDAQSIAKLALELGYDVDDAAMRHRLAQVREQPEHAVFVAALDGQKVVGWVHVQLHQTLLSRAFVEISGLVVSSGFRKLGIGRALMDRAERWAERFAVEDVRVRAQVHRTDAHEFYEHLGYERTKEQRVFRRPVERMDPGGIPTLSD